VGDNNKQDDQASIEQLIHACQAILCSDEEDDLRQLSLDEAIGYAFTLLEEAGMSDPESYLRQRGFLV
jgi:hypothetical protein